MRLASLTITEAFLGKIILMPNSGMFGLTLVEGMQRKPSESLCLLLEKVENTPRVWQRMRRFL